jgi:hypothetical protein
MRRLRLHLVCTSRHRNFLSAQERRYGASLDREEYLHPNSGYHSTPHANTKTAQCVRS